MAARAKGKATKNLLRVALVGLAAASAARAEEATTGKCEQPGGDFVRDNGYKGPQTCEECHAGTTKAFLQTVHWKHASKATNVENLDPAVAAARGTTSPTSQAIQERGWQGRHRPGG